MRYFFTISKHNNQYLSTYFKVDNNNILENRNTLNKEIDHSICYDKIDFTAIIEDDLNETINQIQNSTSKTTQIDRYNKISIPKNQYYKIQKDYTALENCAVFSPYHILLDQAKIENRNFTLNILIYNSKIYSIVVNENFQIIFYNINKLTPSEEIESSKFYTNDAQKQQLIQEVLQLELQKNIKNLIEEFYDQEDSFFIENINIFDPQMILKIEHTDKIAKNISLEIYHQNIDINEILLRLTQKELNYNNLSYTNIKPEQRKDNSIYFILPILAILGLAIGYYFVITKSTIDNYKQTHTPVVKSTAPIKKDLKVQLPSHQELNKKLINNLDYILDSITYDGFIEELTIEKNSATLKLQLLHNDSFIKNIQPNLLKVYSDIKVLETKEFEYIYNSKVQCTNLIANTHEVKTTFQTYPQNKIYSEEEIQTLIKSSFKNIQIISTKSKDFTYSLEVKKSINTPKEIYEIVSKLDSFNRAINISYPITLKKTEDRLEVEFILQYHQKKVDPK